jgi:hypothetical protein
MGLPARRSNVYGAPEQRPALEPWVVLVAALRGQGPDVETRPSATRLRLHGRFDFDALDAAIFSSIFF